MGAGLRYSLNAFTAAPKPARKVCSDTSFTASINHCPREALVS